jgi:hypothetical protein
MYSVLMAELDDILSDDSLRYLSEVKPVIRKKYGIDLEELLKEPANYEDNPGMADKVRSIEKDVDAFFDQRIAGMSSEAAELKNALAAIDGDTKKITQAITTKASIGQVPFVRPLYVDVQGREEIIVEGYDASVDQLVTRMINISDYIAELSTVYKDYTIGSWLFSGRNKYLLSISPPSSEIIVMDRSRDEIKGLLESVRDSLSVK